MIVILKLFCLKNCVRLERLLITYCTPLSLKEWGRPCPILCQQGRFPGKVQPDHEHFGPYLCKHLDSLHQAKPWQHDLCLYLQCQPGDGPHHVGPRLSFSGWGLCTLHLQLLHGRWVQCEAQHSHLQLSTWAPCAHATGPMPGHPVR
jgi:hypothetical protein